MIRFNCLCHFEIYQIILESFEIDCHSQAVRIIFSLFLWGDGDKKMEYMGSFSEELLKKLSLQSDMTYGNYLIHLIPHNGRKLKNFINFSEVLH